MLQEFRLTRPDSGIIALKELFDDFARRFVQLFVLLAHGFIRLPGSALKYQ
jgi:hypothetical protein